jgi:hypothetical protein
MIAEDSRLGKYKTVYSYDLRLTLQSRASEDHPYYVQADWHLLICKARMSRNGRPRGSLCRLAYG